MRTRRSKQQKSLSRSNHSDLSKLGKGWLTQWLALSLGYWVDAYDGTVKGPDGRVIEPEVDASGYLKFKLDGLPVWCGRHFEGEWVFPHLLQALICYGPKAHGRGMVVIHRDGDKTNNRYRNISVSKQREGTTLHPQDVREIRVLIRCGRFTHKEIANKYGVSRSTVSMIKSGARYGWVK